MNEKERKFIKKKKSYIKVDESRSERNNEFLQGGVIKRKVTKTGE